MMRKDGVRGPTRGTVFTLPVLWDDAAFSNTFFLERCQLASLLRVRLLEGQLEFWCLPQEAHLPAWTEQPLICSAEGR